LDSNADLKIDKIFTAHDKLCKRAIDIEVLEKELSDLQASYFQLKNDLNWYAADLAAWAISQGLPRRDPVPMEQPILLAHSVSEWLIRAERIREKTGQFSSAGKDIDLPLIYVPQDEHDLTFRCLPCDVRKNLFKIFDNLKPEWTEVLRVKHGIHNNENVYLPSFHNHLDDSQIGVELGMTPTFARLRLARAVEALKTGDNLRMLVKLYEEIKRDDHFCPAAKLVRNVVEAEMSLSDLDKAP
jgi:hypothetical protein